MTSLRMLTALIALSGMAWAERASAQESPIATQPLRVIGDFRAGVAPSQGRGMGVAAAASIGILIPNWATDFRVEGMLTSWQQPSARLDAVGLAASRSLPSISSGATPYVIVGSGLYASPGRSAAFGASAGLGLRFQVRGMRPFAEMRMHTWFESTPEGKRANRATPVLLGIRF